MFPREARLAALLVLSSCTRGPNLSEVRLVGTWQMKQRLPAQLETQIRASGRDPVQVLEQATSVLEAEGVRMTETFTVDGKWVVSGEVVGHPSTAESTWDLVEDRGDRISIQ